MADIEHESSELTVDPAAKRAPLDIVRDKLLAPAQREEIQKQLPPGVSVDRFIRTTITVVQMNPELLQCTSTSFFGSIMAAAKDGLLPDGREAVIQTYNCNVAAAGQPKRWEKRAQYMPMVRGLIQIMYRSGQVKMVDGVAVYERDDFEYERGDAPRIIHKPYGGAENPGPIVAAYCIIKLNNGEVKREVMFKRDLDKVREASSASQGPGWKNWEDQFCIKAVIKRAFKQLDSDSQELFSHAIQADNEAMGFEFNHAESKKAAAEAREGLISTAKAGEPNRLKAIIGRTKEETEPEQKEPEPETLADIGDIEDIPFGD